MATNGSSSPCKPGKGLDPDKSGVANNDIDWLARGNSLSVHDKGTRRARSCSLPTKQTDHQSGCSKKPDLAPIKSNSRSSTASPEIEDGDEPSLTTASTTSSNGSTLARIQTLPEMQSKPLDRVEDRLNSNDDSVLASTKKRLPSASSPVVNTKKASSWFHSFRFHHSPTPEDPEQQQQQQPVVESPRVSSPQLNSEPAVSPSASPLKPTGSLMHKLKRFSSRSATPVSPANDSQVHLEESRDRPRVVLNKNWNRQRCKLPELEGVLPKRVSFDPKVLLQDPPQQIPSRHPKQGNITVNSNGEVVRTSGYCVATAAAAAMGAGTAANSSYYLPRNYAATAAMASQTAHEAAVRIANSLKSSSSSFRSKFLPSQNNESAEDEAEVQEVMGVGPGQKNLKIDTPMMSDDKEDTQLKTSPSADQLEPDSSLESIYTRCCHLREILPIPATMKQIKGREAPLDIIRMMNPRPTLIEILSFADFLAAVPIHMVILDNAHLTDDMLIVILSGLRKATSLYKLSLKNVLIGEGGWKALCAFLSENQSLSKLDLSIQIDPKRTKQQIKPGTNRANMDWNIFVKSLVVRGGIDELLLNGCMIPGENLDSLIQEACSIGTQRLGLALNDLQREDLAVIKQWLESPTCNCQGLDLGGNDLSDCWDTVISILSHRNLLQLSLNATCLKDPEKASELLSKLVDNEKLRYLDLSSNPKLFPVFTPTLANWLPKFKDLRRIHLDSNNLSSDDVVQLSEALAHCPSMVHISMLNNRKMDGTACAALTTAVDISSTIYRVETDSDIMPESIKRRLAHFCLVNMEATVAGKLKEQESADVALVRDQGDLVEVGTELAHAVSDILTKNKDDDELKCCQVADKMVQRGRYVRKWIHESLEDLFQKKQKEGLSTKSKEMLIKLVVLDGNLEKVFNWYDQIRGTKSDSIEMSHPSEHIMGIVSDNNSMVANPQHPDLQVEPIAHETLSISRQPSSTSLHAKAQELEEGELHKFGTFMRKQSGANERPHSDDSVAAAASGEQIRRAILTAKGTETVNSLIDRVKQTHGPELESLMKTLQSKHENGANGQSNLDDKVLDSVINDLVSVMSSKS